MHGQQREGAAMNDEVYRQRYTVCGKANCRTCRDGKGHGPYWYAYRIVDGKTKQRYVGKSLPPDALPIGRHHEQTLVGRTSEIERLRLILTAVERMKRGKQPRKNVPAPPLTAQCVILTGEIGIGKTRVLEEVGREAQAREWQVVWSRAVVQEQHLPYNMWSDVLRKILLASTAQQELEQRPHLYRPLNALVPGLHSLLPEVELPTPVPAEQEQLRLWEAARELLTNVAESTPLLIVLDDLHWSDSSSCELLAYLARRISGHSIVIVGTCRDKELPENHALRPLLTELQHEGVIETVSLEPLSKEQIAALIAQVAPPRHSLSEPLIERIQDRAAGNPFFAEELVRGVNLQSDATPLPASITAVFDLRLSRLSKACHHLLSKAAVLGGSFEFPLIQAMESTSMQEADEDTILDLLEEGLTSGLLTEEGVGARITYLFWHPLLVSHLYEELSAVRRANLHRRAADILRHRYQDRENEGAAIITQHLVLGGGNPQHIIYYAKLAGDRAYTLSAYPDAAKYYQIALEQIDVQPHLASDELMQLAYLLEKAGECLRVQGRDEEARHTYERLLTIRSMQRVAASGLLDASREIQRDALLWCEIGWTWYGSGNNTETLVCCQRGEQLLSIASIVEGAAWATIRFQQSYVYWQEGRADYALSTAREAQHLFHNVVEGHHPIPTGSQVTRTDRTLAGDPLDLGKTYSLLGSLLLVSGRLSSAVEQLQQALEIFEQSSHPREIATVCCTLSDIYLRRGAYKEANEVLQRSLMLAERIGDTPLLAVICVNLGMLALREEQMIEAETWLKRGVALAQQIHDPVYLSLFHSNLALVLDRQHKDAEARPQLASALWLARSLQSTQCLGVAFVALAAWYITRARTQIENQKHPAERSLHWLHRAQGLLHQVVRLQEIESEVRIEATVYLAEVSLMLGERQQAHHQALHALDAAQHNELFWLLARIKSLIAVTSSNEDNP